MSEFKELIDYLSEKYNIEEIVKFNEFNIKEKLEELEFRKMEFNKLFLISKYKYEEMYDSYEKLVGFKYHKLKFNGNELLNKNEIEKYYLSKDEDVITAKKSIRKQRAEMEFFEMCVRMLSDLKWEIQSYVKIIAAGF